MKNSLAPMKITRFLVLLLAMLLMESLQVSAGTADTVSDCSKAVTTAEMLRCADKEFREADAELNRVYRQLTAELNGRRKIQLKASQRAWLAFRDRNAVFAAGAAEGGSMASLLEVAELTALTQARTEQLRVYLKK
ncbi:MAG: DUF1311 domain-containing protein [Desulfobulbus sp.]|nr:DUF1311 domain-containing protein [Desulfobulbus sp.]